MHANYLHIMLMASVSLLWLVPVNALGAEISDRQKQPLELAPLIQEAIENNPDIVAAKAYTSVTKERIPQAGALDDPDVYVRFWNTPESLNIAKTDTTIYGIGQRFPVPGLLAQKEEVARYASKQAEQQLAAKALEISASVTAAYYELYYAYKALTVHHEQVKLLKHFFEIANAKFKVGKGTQVDVLRAQVELSKLFQHLPTLEQRRETAQAQVNTLLNRSPLAPLGIPQIPDPQPLNT